MKCRLNSGRRREGKHYNSKKQEQGKDSVTQNILRELGADSWTVAADGERGNKCDIWGVWTPHWTIPIL